MSGIFLRAVMIMRLITPFFHDLEIFFNRIEWRFALVTFLFYDQVYGTACPDSLFQHFFYVNNTHAEDGTFIAMLRTSHSYFIFYMKRSKTSRVFFNHIQSPAASVIHIANV